MITEIPCPIKKHFSPYRCEFVPSSVLLSICLEYPKLSKIVFLDDHIKWLNESMQITWGNGRISERTIIRKKYWNSLASKRLQEIIQRRLNYTKSTYTTGHILHRAGRVYREWIECDHIIDSKNKKVIFNYNTAKL